MNGGVGYMKTKPVAHNVVARRGRTSIRLEIEFWNALKDIARREGLSLNEVIQKIEEEYEGESRVSKTRAFCVNYYRDIAIEKMGGGQKRAA